MTAVPRRLTRRHGIGLGLALAGSVAGWFWLEGSKLPAVPENQSEAPFIKIGGRQDGGADAVVRERAELLDPTPLFLPSGYNFGARRLPTALEKQPGQVFGDFGPKLSFGASRPDAIGWEGSTSESLTEVLSRSDEVPFAGLGEIATQRASPLAPKTIVFVKRMGEKVFGVLDVDVPKLDLADFSPMEFVVSVGSAGVVGSPIRTAGSAKEDSDALFERFLIQDLRLGARLSPGKYQVVIGP